MRTGIYVYKTTEVQITTSESGLYLSTMTTVKVALAEGLNSVTIEPGIYKVISSYEVEACGNCEAVDFTFEPNDKTSGPTLPPRILALNEDPMALNAFFAVPDAKAI